MREELIKNHNPTNSLESYRTFFENNQIKGSSSDEERDMELDFYGFLLRNDTSLLFDSEGLKGKISVIGDLQELLSHREKNVEIDLSRNFLKKISNIFNNVLQYKTAEEVPKASIHGNLGFPDHLKSFLEVEDIKAVVQSGLLGKKDSKLLYCNVLNDGRACLEDIGCKTLDQAMYFLRSYGENIQRLNLHYYRFKINDSALREIIECCPNLKFLGLKGCGLIKTLAVLRDLPYLEDLDLSGCFKLKTIDNLPCPSLKSLNLSGCYYLETIALLQILPSMEKLDISFCRSLQYVDTHSFPKLEDLRLVFCKTLQNFDFINLPKIKHLELRECMWVRNLQNFRHLTSIETLNLEACRNLLNIDGLDKLTSLKHLVLKKCKQLQNVSSLKYLTNLENLDLSGCSKLRDVESIANLCALEHLDLSACDSMNSFPLLNRLENLKTLNLSNNLRMQVFFLQDMPSLTTLDLSLCRHLRRCELENLSNLKSLNLSSNRSLRSVSLNNLARITSLDLETSLWLNHVNIENCSSLRYLNLQNSRVLNSINLNNLENLRELKLEDCPKFQGFLSFLSCWNWLKLKRAIPRASITL